MLIGRYAEKRFRSECFTETRKMTGRVVYYIWMSIYNDFGS